jgi:membrane protease YdiL (CAAX protease family)
MLCRSHVAYLLLILCHGVAKAFFATRGADIVSLQRTKQHNFTEKRNDSTDQGTVENSSSTHSPAISTGTAISGRDMASSQWHQVWRGFSHGAGFMLVKCDDILAFWLLRPLCSLSVELISKVPTVYQTYWYCLGCLSYFSRAHFTGVYMQLFHLAGLSQVYFKAHHLVPERLRPLLKLLNTCISGPIREELIFRYFPDALCSALFARRFNGNKSSSNHRQVVFSKLFFAICRVLYSASHIANQIDLGTKLVDIPLEKMQSVTAECCWAFFMASNVFEPLFQRHGLWAAVGAHVVWKTCVEILFCFRARDRFVVIALLADVWLIMNWNNRREARGRAIPESEGQNGVHGTARPSKAATLTVPTHSTCS